MKFEIDRNPEAKGDQWFWHLKGGNGEIVCVSQMLSSKQTCQNTINSIKSSIGSHTPVIDLTVAEEEPQDDKG